MTQNVNEERMKILSMAAEKKVTAEEAAKLLDALDKSHRTGGLPKMTKKFLRVTVESPETNVDVKVPLQLIAAGMNISAFLPEKARDEIDNKINLKGGLDFSKMSEELLVALQELDVKVDSEKAKIRVFCE